MNYIEALNYIDNLSALGSRLDLSRIREILKRLGDPQDRLKIIHVAGTNGKGSVSSMLTQILIEAGYRTALYTSPHLERYNERYKINDKEISNEEFAEYIERIKFQADEMNKEPIGRPTVFEQLTAAAYLYFAEQNVDYAVIEVGLGGRFDATNVVKKPVLSVITSISLDHTEFLGNTIESIAFEKGGIIKEGCPVVLYRQDKRVYDVINKLCIERNAKLYYNAVSEIRTEKSDINGTTISIKNDIFDIKNIFLPLIGQYQLKNCETAVLAAVVLRKYGINISDENILKGIADTKWNGRMEVCSKNPLTIIDGAHNADGVYMLAESVKKYFTGRRIVLLMGVLGDKEYDKMASEIVPLVDTAVITEPDSDRALSAEGFKNVVSRYCDKVYSIGNIKEAYEFALSLTGKDDVLLCAGSLYLIGRLRTIIMGGI